MAILFAYKASAQLTPAVFQQYLLNKDRKDFTNNFQSETEEFYAVTGYNTAWIQQNNLYNLNSLLDNLSSAENYGLKEKDYQYSFIQAFKKGSLPLLTQEDSLHAELIFTNAAIHFYSDIAYGNTRPSFKYSGLNYQPACRDIPVVLAQYVLKKDVTSLALKLSPGMAEIPILENQINWMANIIRRKDFKEISLSQKKINSENKFVYAKLYQLGILDSIYEKMSESRLKEKIKSAQVMFNLPVNGELNAALIHELNVPIEVRLRQLNLSINYYRWLSCLTQDQPVIVVNIPAAYLKVYQNNKVNLEMRLVVGKPSTPTITLSSMVNEVIVYPYWHVPASIATKELLPLIKKNTSFLGTNNYQVLNKSGKIVNPYSINWHALSRNYFPYTIRQATGCDNSLGLLKLNFYNPFGAYLHDTPNKELFKQQQRFFSHGCMRMEKPIDLGHLLLKGNQVTIDTLTEKGCLNNQSPIVVAAEEKMPVIIWYNPAGVDSTGKIVFFQDIYHQFIWTNK
jgi:murein L,D-transpeptidase YcbB/YkuD